MKARPIVLSGLIVLLLLALVSLQSHHNPLQSKAVYAAMQAAPDPCTFPMQVSSSMEETAWRLFVAASCPVYQKQYPYVAWENWLDQYQVYPANGLQSGQSIALLTTVKERFHISPLQQLMIAHAKGMTTIPEGANEGCGPATAAPHRILCEETRLDPNTMSYVDSENLWNRAGQMQAAQLHRKMQFPGPSMEIKADWLQLGSCSNPPEGVHVEEIQGKCYALAGMHLISKLKDSWIWATFEAQNLTTNPNRCVTLGCNDPWGSSPAESKGGASGVTQLTPALASLEKAAKLSPEWGNYRLDGVQTAFEDASGKPILLGNSIIEEENVGLNLNHTSCMSCHAASSVENNGTDGITLLTSSPIGKPAPLPSDAWIRRDFVWSLGLACPGPGLQNCSSATVASMKKKGGK